MTTVVRYGDRPGRLGQGIAGMGAGTEYALSGRRRRGVREWTPAARAAVTAALRDSAGQAMRTLAFGHAVLPADFPSRRRRLHARRESLETGLVFAGFVAIRDPLREDVKDAVAQCRKAGIEVKMITGDNVETARAIAYEIGLIDRRDAPSMKPAPSC